MSLNGQVDGFATDIQQVTDTYESLSSQVDGLAILSGRYNIVYENCVWITPVTSGANCGGQGERNCCGEGGVVTNFRLQRHSSHLHWVIKVSKHWVTCFKDSDKIPPLVSTSKAQCSDLLI